jgi:hypothetical protein
MKSKKHPLDFIKPGFSFKKGGAVPCHECMQSKQYGGSNVITSPLGQWAYPGEVTRIPSNQITMQGVNYPVLGVDNTGYRQMMMPGGEYTFPGTSVTEYPMMYGQVGLGMPAGMFDTGVQRSDATRVSKPVYDPREVAKAKQDAINARAQEIARGRGSEKFLGMFNVPVDYSGVERQNAPTLAQKKLAAEKAQGKVYNNLVEAAFMAAGPVSDIIGVAKTAAPQITANRALFDPGSQRAITTTTPKLLPSPTTLPNTGESLGSVDDVISASGKYRTRLGANEATNVYEGNWYWNTDYPAATLHDLNTGVSPEWFYNRSFSNQIDRFKRAMSQPGLSQGEKVLPNSKNFITSTPVTNPSTGEVFYNPSSLAKSGALQFKGPMMKFDPISKTVTDPTLKLYDYYPEAVRFPGSEVREMMPVSAGTLYDQYYLPFKMGGSKKSRKSRR